MFLIRKYTFTSALLHTQSLHLRHILKANHESTHISLVSIVSLNKSASTVSQFLPHRAEHLPLLLPRVKCLPFFFPFYFLDALRASSKYSLQKPKTNHDDATFSTNTGGSQPCIAHCTTIVIITMPCICTTNKPQPNYTSSNSSMFYSYQRIVFDKRTTRRTSKTVTIFTGQITSHYTST